MLPGENHGGCGATDEAKARAADVQAKVAGLNIIQEGGNGALPGNKDTDLPSIALRAPKLWTSHRAREVGIKEMEARTENENRDRDRAPKSVKAQSPLLAM